MKQFSIDLILLKIEKSEKKVVKKVADKIVISISHQLILRDGKHSDLIFLKMINYAL